MAFLRTTLGRTGLKVGRLGLGASYGVPAKAVERAFDHGVNYFYWGSVQRYGFGQAVGSLAPHRDRFVFVLQSYARLPALLTWGVEYSLRETHLEYADILLLGLWNHAVWPFIRDAARELRNRGLVRFLGLSTHRRPLIAEMAGDPDFDVFHVRYNAVHRGAEEDVFPLLPKPVKKRPGIVSFTATSWKQLLSGGGIPRTERSPTAGDCYRFVLSRPEVNVCLTGPADAAEMDHALAALEKGPMSEGELAWMRRVGTTIYSRAWPAFV